MSTATTQLTDLIRLAENADRSGNVVMRQEYLRSIEDLRLPPSYVVRALTLHGLIRTYHGPRS